MVLISGITYSDIQDALDRSQNDYSHDMGLIMGWYCEQLARVLTFGGSSELNGSGEIINPSRFETGINLCGSSTQLDINSYKTLDTFIIDTSSNIPSGNLGFFNGILFLRYGFSKDYDISVKTGGFKINPSSNFVVNNSILGTEIRMQMLDTERDGFDLAGGVSFNLINGYIDITSTGTVSTGEILFEGTTYYQTTNSAPKWKVNWNFNSISLRAVGSVKLTFLRPFAGLQIDINSGKTEGNCSDTGIMTLTDIQFSTNTQTGTININGSGSSTIPNVNTRLILGAELNFSAVKIGLAFESAGNSGAGIINLRFNF